MLGLFAFFYGCLHLATYLALDQGFDWPGDLEGMFTSVHTLRRDLPGGR